MDCRGFEELSSEQVVAINGVAEHLLMKAGNLERKGDRKEAFKELVAEICEIAELTRTIHACRTVKLVYKTCPL